MAEPPAAGAGAVARAFWQGFSTPSALAFRAFLAALAATLALALWFFSETALSGPAGDFLPRSGRDAEAFATVAALRAGAAAPARPRLLVLGSSSMAQALGSAAALRTDLAAAAGQDWEVVVLTTPLQAPTDQFALLDRALAGQRADSPPAVVVLGVGLTRLRWSPERLRDFARRQRLGLRSAWEDAEIAALGGTPAPQRGIYVLDNARFVAGNGAVALLRLLARQPAGQQLDSYAEGPPGPRPEARAALGAEIRAGDPAAVLAQLGRLAERLATRPGVRLVLAEEPMSPALVAAEDLAAPRAALRAALAGFAARHGAALLRPAEAAGLAAADFHDDLHLRPGPAQARFRAALAAGLAGILAAEGGDGGG